MARGSNSAFGLREKQKKTESPISKYKRTYVDSGFSDKRCKAACLLSPAAYFFLLSPHCAPTLRHL